MKLRLFSPALILIVIHRYECMYNTIKFERKSNLDGYSCPVSERLFSVTVSVDDPIECSLACTTVPSCQYVSYHTDTGQCDGCSEIYNDVFVGHLYQFPRTRYYQRQVCPAGWSRWQSSCYKPTNKQSPFSEGKTECEKNQGHAVHIESIEENTFIMQTFYDTFDVVIFIGVVYSTSIAQWTYDGTEIPAFTNFASIEGYNVGQYCTSLWKDYDEQWADITCDSHGVTLCEINL